jgi:hypothetical protein
MAKAKPDFAPVFARLKALMEPLADRLVVVTDTPTEYYLDTTAIGPNKRPICFGSVCVMKNYVSYHLMPVYGCPKLLDGVSDELLARMQGKSCFNFTTVDEKLMKELGQLTKRGLQAFRKMSWA